MVFPNRHMPIDFDLMNHMIHQNFMLVDCNITTILIKSQNYGKLNLCGEFKTTLQIRLSR